MKIKIKVCEESWLPVKYAKLSFFAIGGLVALPMVAVAVVLEVVEFLVSVYFEWLREVTDTDFHIYR